MLLQFFELASNKALEFDSGTRARLDKLQGRTLCLHITSLNQSVVLTPQASGLEFSSIIPEHVDVTLKASLPALVKLGRDGLDDAELEPGELEIIGDPLVGQRFAQLIAQLDIDWDELLSDQFGPSPAKVISSVAVSAAALAKEGRAKLHEFVLQGIKENDDMFADPLSARESKDQIDALATQVTQLEKRLKALLDRV